jgi:hypothetical protein
MATMHAELERLAGRSAMEVVFSLKDSCRVREARKDKVEEVEE